MNKLLIVGDVMLDATIDGNVSKFSPEAPVPVILNPKTNFQLGGAANVALNCVGLGEPVFIASILGDDETADTIMRLITSKSIGSSFSRLNGHTSTKKLRIKSGLHQFLRCDYEKQVPLCDSETFIEQLVQSEFIKEFSVLVLSDYGKGVLSKPQTLIKAGLSLNMKVIIDPKGNDFSRYAGATIITPNLDEAQQVFGDIDGSGFDEKVLGFLRTYSVENMCITLGSEGLKNYNKSGKVTSIPSQAISVFDVTGAGDSFVAGVAVSLLSGECIQRALEFGNRVAGIAVSKNGTYPVSKEDL